MLRPLLQKYSLLLYTDCDMPAQYSHLRILVASPHDVAEERLALRQVVDAMNQEWLHSRGLHFEVVGWETTHPGVGTDPQDVINEQIGDDYDIFVGVLWSRFGSPTPRAGSGTAEEFLAAYNRHLSSPTTLRILFYFSEAPIVPSAHDLNQVQRVLDFRRDLSNKGLLYYTYNTVDQFRDFVRLHLAALAIEYGTKWGPGTGVGLEAPDAYELAPTPRTARDLSDTDHGFLDLILEATQAMEDVQHVVESMTGATKQLGEDIGKRSAQIERTKGGDRQSLQRVKYISDGAGEDMQSFVAKMDADIPRFAVAYATAVDAYAKATLMLPDFTQYDINGVISALETIGTLTRALRESQTKIAYLRDSVAKTPPVSTRLTQAKNKTVAILRRLDEEWTRAIDISAAVEPPLLNMLPAERKVSLGSNAFFGVAFPLVLADRFFMVSGEVQSPRLTVFRWDPSARRAFYEIVDNQVQSDNLDSSPTGTLTFAHPQPSHFLCTFRARPDVDQILGKVPIDALFQVAITEDSIRVTGGENELTLEKNQFQGFLIGIAVAADGSISVGSNEIPPGMILDSRPP